MLDAIKKKGWHLIQIVRLLKSSVLSAPSGLKKVYPQVIQLPLTYRCNSRCVMCNIWKMDHSGEVSVEEVAGFVNDEIFKEVTAVGINGGEPFLISELPGYVVELLKLPKLQSLNIITNGFNTERILANTAHIYKLCQARNVKLHVSISLDGYGKVHDRVRGVPGVFDKTVKTIDAILANQQLYCDSFDVACTVVKQNINSLAELDAFTRLKGYAVKYRLGIPNKRIQSDSILSNFSVASGNYRQTAAEFFHYQMASASDLLTKFRYYSIYFWLVSKRPRRLQGCLWQQDGITMDARGELYYCAVESKSIGSLRQNSGKEIFFDKKNLQYRSEILQSCCDSCIHDYPGRPRLAKVLQFLRYLLMNKFSMLIYRFKARLIK